MARSQTNVLLVGARGCGKSTVGRALAEACGRGFVDLDDRVLAHFAEPSVTAVWRVRGEAAWREAETKALEDALRATALVVALGGGTPMIDAARALIDRARREGSAAVAYLRCTADVLAARVRAEPGDRPSLTGAGVADEMAAVLAEREPTYLAIADLVCDGDDRGAAEIVAELLAWMEGG